MVLMGDFLNNVKRLINQYVYTKEQTRQNFDDFIENEVRYINGNFIVNEDYTYPKGPILFQPAFDGKRSDFRCVKNDGVGRQVPSNFSFGCEVHLPRRAG